MKILPTFIHDAATASVGVGMGARKMPAGEPRSFLLSTTSGVRSPPAEIKSTPVGGKCKKILPSADIATAPVGMGWGWSRRGEGGAC